MIVEIIPCLSDNYSYLIHEKETGTISIVDPSEFNACDKIISKYKIQVKTYEKGVEAMMNSCASGSFACAYDYSIKEKVLGDIEVVNDGGSFIISFNKDYKKSTLIGKAEIEYKGII